MLVMPILGAARGALALTYVTSLTDGTNGTSVQFAGASIGTPAHDRLVVLAIHAQNNSNTAASAPTTVTIGGVTATIHGSSLGTGTNEAGVAIASALVPAGTTATIDIAYPDDQVRFGVNIFSLTGWSNPTPFSVVGSTTNAGTVVDDAFVVGGREVGLYACNHNGSGTASCSFANASEVADSVLENLQANYACAQIAAGAGSVTVSATWSSSGDMAALGALWR